MSDELKLQYADRLHWLEMGIPYSESETGPHEMVFRLAMEWEDVVPLLQRIAELESEREILRATILLRERAIAELEADLSKFEELTFITQDNAKLIRIRELEAELTTSRKEWNSLLETAEARLDAVEAFCERAVNAYPDLRDEYEALEQKDDEAG